MHPEDEFHTPTTDDPEWTETCWFTFAVPERNLSGQLYPYFKTNQGVAAGGAFFWDGRNERPETCVYAKQFWHLPLADQKLTDLTLAFLPAIRASRGGLMNVASTAAFYAGPGMAVYYATKAFVLSFSQALAYELKEDGVRVTALCPGPTKTEFFERAGAGE